MENFHGLTALNMRVNFTIMQLKAKDITNGRTVEHTMVHGLRTPCMVKESLLILMEGHTLVNLLMIRSMAEESSLGLMDEHMMEVG